MAFSCKLSSREPFCLVILYVIDIVSPLYIRMLVCIQKLSMILRVESGENEMLYCQTIARVILNYLDNAWSRVKDN